MPALALTEEERRSALAELDAADAAEPQFNVASLAPEEKSAALAELDAADKAAQTAQPESYDERVARLSAKNTPVVPHSTGTSTNPLNVLSWEKPYVPGEGKSGIVQKAGNFVGNLVRGAAPVVAGAALGTAAEGGIPGPGTIAGGAAGALAGNLAEQARNEKVKAFHTESNTGPRSLVQKFKEEPVKSITSAVVDTAMGALQLKTADTLRRSTLEAVKQFGRSPEARKAIAKEIAVNLGVDVTTGNVQAGTQYLIDGGDPGSREFLDLMLESTATNAVVSGAGAYMTNRGHKTRVANEAAQEAARIGAEHPTGRSGPEVFWRRQQPVAGAPESVVPLVEVRPDGTRVNPALRSKLAPEPKQPHEMSREEFAATGPHDTDSYIREKTGAKSPQELLSYYQAKYPELEGVKIGGWKPSKESGPVKDAGVTRLVRDDGKFNPSESIIHLSKDASLTTMRHEIEHLLDAVHGRSDAEIRNPDTGKESFGRGFRHDEFGSDYLHRSMAKDAIERGDIESHPDYPKSPAGAARPSVNKDPAIPSATQAPESTPIAQPQPVSAAAPQGVIESRRAREKKSKAKAPPDEQRYTFEKSKWRDAVDEQTDPMRKTDVLRKMARGLDTPASDFDEILDRAFKLPLEYDVYRYVSGNKNASPKARARAEALHEAFSAREDIVEQPQPKADAPGVGMTKESREDTKRAQIEAIPSRDEPAPAIEGVERDSSGFIKFPAQERVKNLNGYTAQARFLAEAEFVGMLNRGPKMLSPDEAPGYYTALYNYKGKLVRTSKGMGLDEYVYEVDHKKLAPLMLGVEGEFAAPKAKAKEAPKRTVPQVAAPIAKPRPEKNTRRPRKLLGVGQISDFEQGRDKVERRGDRMFVVDSQGQRADTEVQSDKLTPETEANLRKLPKEKLAQYREQTAQTHVLSSEGRAERLAIFDEMIEANKPKKSAFPRAPKEPKPKAAKPDPVERASLIDSLAKEFEGKAIGYGEKNAIRKMPVSTYKIMEKHGLVHRPGAVKDGFLPVELTDDAIAGIEALRKKSSKPKDDIDLSDVNPSRPLSPDASVKSGPAAFSLSVDETLELLGDLKNTAAGKAAGSIINDSIRAIVRFAGSGADTLKNMGKAGTVLRDLIHDAWVRGARPDATRAAVQMADAFHESGVGFLRGRHLFDDLGQKIERVYSSIRRIEGQPFPLEEWQKKIVSMMTPAEKKIADLWLKLHTELAESFNAVGAKIFDPETNETRPMQEGWDGFFPQMLKQEYMEQIQTERGAKYKEAVQMLIDKGQAKDIDDAKMLLREYFRTDFDGFAAGIERPRKIKWPDEMREWNPTKVFDAYFTRGYNRLHEIRVFGQQFHGEPGRLQAVLDAIKKESSHRDALRNVETATKISQGVFGLRPPVNRFISTLGSFEVSTKVGNLLNVLLQVDQNINTLTGKGAEATLGGIKDVLFNAESKKLVRTSGAITEDYAKQIAEIGRHGFWSKMAEAMLKIQGSTFVDRSLRVWDAAAAHRFAYNYIEEAKLHPNSRKAQRMRRELVRMHLPEKRIDAWLAAGKLSTRDAQELMIHSVRESQFESDYLARTQWANEGWGRVFYQLKNFAFHKARFVYKNVIVEARHGNLRPFAYLMLGSILHGEAYTLVKNKVLGRERQDEDLSDIGEGVVQDAEFMPLFERAWHDLLAAGTFGILGDSMSSRVSDAPLEKMGGAVPGFELGDTAIRSMAEFLTRYFGEDEGFWESALGTTDSALKRESVLYSRVKESKESGLLGELLDDDDSDEAQ